MVSGRLDDLIFIEDPVLNEVIPYRILEGAKVAGIITTDEARLQLQGKAKDGTREQYIRFILYYRPSNGWDVNNSAKSTRVTLSVDILRSVYQSLRIANIHGCILYRSLCVSLSQSVRFAGGATFIVAW